MLDLFDDEPAVNTLVYDLVYAGGTLSTRTRHRLSSRDWLRRYPAASQPGLMRVVKRVLDPLGLMNPGKVLVRAPYFSMWGTPMTLLLSPGRTGSSTVAAVNAAPENTNRHAAGGVCRGKNGEFDDAPQSRALTVTLL